ncbi:hypothetical protein F5883DRAFT_85525 [Diaporthe sp. PMI_573]|nr:hypothetical protein F5883DRAFT_85525 [Diaporthaceae sp. PMI_573]
MKSTDPVALRISSKSCDARETTACTDHRDEQPVRKDGEWRKTGASHLGASPSALAPFPFRREPGEALGAWNTRSRGKEAGRRPGWHYCVSGRRLSARRCEGSGVDRAAGQDDEGNQGTVPPRGSRQANLAWLSLVHRTRPDQTLCSRRQRRAQVAETKAASGAQVRAERRSHASDLRAAARLWPGAQDVAAFLFEKFHPGDGAMTESTPNNHKSLIGFARLVDVGGPVSEPWKADERSVCSAVIVSGLMSGGITSLEDDVVVMRGARLASQPSTKA